MNNKDRLSRRDFLRISALALGGMAMSSGKIGRSLVDSFPFAQDDIPVFPENETLGRMCVGQPGANVSIKSEPYWDATDVGTAYFDDVFTWRQEVMAKSIDPYRINQRWVETDQGYIYAEYLQKVWHQPQEVLTEIPLTDANERGMWVEITTPITNIVLTRDKASYQYWVRETIRPRLYYSQVFWAVDVRTDPTTGKQQYLLMQRYNAYPDTYWVDASICRRITPEEVAPIHPDAVNKHIIVNLIYQTLSCLEDGKEVFFTSVTTGGYNEEEAKWITPVGNHTIWRKTLSTHMSGNITGGYDIPGIPWTTLFDNNGAAIHSTFWHNFYGTPRSHGCVNARPEDAKWVWRWTEPAVPYDPGDMTIQGLNKSTQVEVIAE